MFVLCLIELSIAGDKLTRQHLDILGNSQIVNSINTPIVLLICCPLFEY